MTAVTEEPATRRKIRQRFETVTPEMATRWLEANTSNRNLSQSTVEEYARDMAAGKWHLTGEPLQFGVSGRLLNGQHRLWACIYADTTFETAVVRGIVNEEEVMNVIDTGKKRTLGNALQIRGEKDAALLASVINTCWRYERGTIKHKAAYPTHEEGLEWLRENPDVRAATVIARRAHTVLKVNRSAAGAAYYLNSRADQEASEMFWDGVATGEGLGAGNPILAYRRWVISTLGKRDKPNLETWLSYSLKAMTQWRAGKSVRLLQIKPGDEIWLWTP